MYRLFKYFRPRKGFKNLPNEGRMLHLGCGSNLLEGWANIDFAGSSEIIVHDLTRSLPLGSGTVDFIFTEHFVEHISRQQGQALFEECYRLLASGGVLRISTPSLKKLIDEYASGRVDEWADVDWNPETPCQMLNEGVRLWGHQFIYDFDEISQALSGAGFVRIKPVDWRESTHRELSGLECRPFHNDLIVEAEK